VKIDLHNHSCLSPCGSLELSPTVLATTAAARGIDVLALTDHNSAANCPAFAEACARVGISPLFGLEVTTTEEAHVLTIFDSLEAALDMGRWIDRFILKVPLDPIRMGDQVIVDVDERIEGTVDHLLIMATSLSLDQVLLHTHDRGGLFIPSHIDRPSYSIISQLGFLPTADYDALEVTPPHAARYQERYPEFKVVTSSDAHLVDSVGRAHTELNIAAPSIAAIRAALSPPHRTRHHS
jgi:PHP family Zn ribbon phosphoesterase